MNINNHSNILDNTSQDSKLGDFLKKIIHPNAELSFVSAYFTPYAFNALKEQLGAIKQLRFLFGEPTFLKKEHKKSFVLQENNLEISHYLQQKAVAKACAEWIRQKVEIKTINKPDFLHAKLYLIKNPASEEDTRLHSVVGSSNFTISGLGFGYVQKNLELNLITDSKSDTKALEQWFNHLWQGHHQAVEVRSVKEEVLAYLEQLYCENTPDFIYRKTLQHLNTRHEWIEEELPISLEKSEIWKKLYEFQKNAVKQIIHKINQYNGCILADSVGLGKTFTALAVIKYFELRNQTVLVLCPKKLRENWRKYQIATQDKANSFKKDPFHYSLLYHSDLTRTKGYSDSINLQRFNWDAYDLVVIDESHHFRNGTEGYNKGEEYIQSRYEKLLNDVIKAGVKTKVLLLSATPVNNDLNDLYHQIRLITHDKDDAFQDSMQINSVEKTLKQAQKKLDAQSENLTKENLIDALDKNVTTLLDNLTIARSRQHIKTYFAESIKAEDLGNFPQRLKPHHEYIDFESLKYSDLVEKINGYKLSLFNPSAYIKAEFEQVYSGKVANFSQYDREYYLIGMMRVNFLKRLESSIFSFKETLKRTLAKIEDLQDKLHTQITDIIVNSQDLETDDLQQMLEEEEGFEWGKLRFKAQHLNIETWLVDLAQDKQQLADLLREIEKVHDSKLQRLQQLVSEKVNAPMINANNRKVLIFTAFADTARYLYDNMCALAKQWQVNIALVTGSGDNQSSLNKKDFEEILTLFSPLSKERAVLYPDESREIDILIATDCISEGQNLQDCDYVINYDIHWNPIRIIQRFGRIDRLGTQNAYIQMVNFWAGKDLESYLQLESRVKARMALVSATTTADENLLEDEKHSSKEKQEKSYRDRQLLLFKENIPELNNEGIQLEYLSFAKFLLALQKNDKDLDNEPLGMYAVVPETEQFKAGVIFCLKVQDEQVKAIAQNRVHPYFLVYVNKREQAVHFHCTEVYKILEMFEALCLGKTEVYQDVCDSFNQETQDGQCVTLYNALLKVALASFEQKTIEKSSATLANSRQGRLLATLETPSLNKSFQLITWLVIQESNLH